MDAVLRVRSSLNSLNGLLASYINSNGLNSLNVRLASYINSRSEQFKVSLGHAAHFGRIREEPNLAPPTYAAHEHHLLTRLDAQLPALLRGVRE